MFSYLRPHHKRAPSNPTSPTEQASFETSSHSVDHGHPRRGHIAVSSEPTLATSPPFLPPHTRVLSAGNDGLPISNEQPRPRAPERDPKAQLWDNSKGNTRPGDTDTFTAPPRMPFAGTQRPESAGNAAPPSYTSSQYAKPLPDINHDLSSIQKSPEPSHNFVTAADLQYKPLPTGKRPTGARLPTPPSSSNAASTFEPVQQKSGKARLNLLNPMSLLARRRTAQAIPQLTPEALATNRTGASFSETFDPRIRGTRVHDFSAPRPKRNVSYNDVRVEDTTNKPSKQYQRSPNPQRGDSSVTDENGNGPWSGGNHTPVFTENFEDQQYPAAGPHVRKATDLSDLPLPKPPYAKGAQRAVEPDFASKGNEISQKQVQSTREISARKPVPESRPPVPPKSEARMLVEHKRISIEPSSQPPKPMPSSNKGRPRNFSEASIKDAAIPKHMKSTSSRFSFDMIGAAEQERLLEDRHRQKALERRAENEDGDDQVDDEFDDEYDYDNMDDDDGLEERIPGVNADLEEEEDPDEIGGSPLAGFTFHQSLLPTPLSPHSPGMASTPRDANGEVIGFAMTKNSPVAPLGLDSAVPQASPLSVEIPSSGIDATIQGLGLNGVNMDTIKPPVNLDSQPNRLPQPTGIEDDDLYFDDGIIGAPGDDDDGFEFDESVFDNVDTDEYGRPLKPLSSLPTIYSPPFLTADPSPSFNKVVENYDDKKNSNDVVSPTTEPLSGGLAPKPSVLESNSLQVSMAQPPSHVLTQDSLAAYQSALAAAAFKAAANGKFRRDSIQTNHTSEQEDNHPGLVPDSNHTSQYEPFSPNYELEDDFDYDDVLEDDPIIAAANAEALANDCDGFYGQEFGFYSAPATGEVQYANGGYFGPRGAEGINRTQSGRVASREPNLTPITERSEYSNRNSFMSPPMHGAGMVTSPGLAQLAGMISSEEFEGDMSLDALLKLRRGAWGGSQVSLHSSNGSPRSAGGQEEPSSVGQSQTWQQGGAVGNPTLSSGQGQGHRRKNSTFSLVSESENSSAPGSPTLAMGMSSSSIFDTSKKDEAGKEDREKDQDKGFKKHKYSGSAESISYLKEEDPVSGDRWILERRRTAESGEVEFVGREIVSGGRI